jgi:hypothetical protein
MQKVRSSRVFTAQHITDSTLSGKDNTFKGPKLVSQLQLQADKPILFLEEYDHLLTDVDCHESMMTITFRDHYSYNGARTACGSLVNGLVVSSHLTCSDDGAHSVST